MTFLTHFHFIRPYGLLLVPLLIGLWWFWQRRTHPLRGWQEQMVPHLLEALVVGHTSTQLRTGRWLIVAWLLAALAIAGPTWRLEPSPFADDATPLLILLKADQSMVQLGQIPSVLDRARLKIADLATARRGQPLGLVAYAGSAHLVLPPTRDTAIVSAMAKEIRPDVMPVPGDRLDLALDEAARLLAQGYQGGSVVIMADSVNTEPGALQTWSRTHSMDVQFLALNQPGSTAAERSLENAAQLLKTAVTPPDVEGKDIAAIIHRAAQSPVARQGGASDRWQEAGYALVPLIALLFLASFRRTVEGEVSP
mgnify:CR=1 FL=1